MTEELSNEKAVDPLMAELDSVDESVETGEQDSLSAALDSDAFASSLTDAADTYVPTQSCLVLINCHLVQH